MLSRIIAFTLLITIPAFAADECDPIEVAPNVIRDLSRVSTRLNVECPNAIHVRNFCAAVSSQAMEMEPLHPSVIYQYQNMIYSAACVLNSDSETAIKAKVQHFWNRYHDQLLCNQSNFVPANGNILKLAIARQSDPFIEDSLNSWGINLNHVDTVDQLTVLDYIENKKRAAGTNASLARTYQQFYDRFKAAGAKHRRDL